MANLGGLAVGSTVKLAVNGTLTSFIIIQHGLPSSVYDSSCDGTWLMSESIYTLRPFGVSVNNYSLSTMHTYLNGDYINLFSEDIKNAIKTVRIPYSKGTGSSGSLAVGANGLETKVFLLSAAEMGYSSNYMRIEGAPVSYFNGVDNTQKIGLYNGNPTIWWLRSPNISGNTTMFYVRQTNGMLVSGTMTNQYGVRPAFILPSDITLDENGNIAVKSFGGFANIGGVNKELAGGHVNIAGAWKDISGIYMNIGGTWKEMP